jgi:LysM repeat protein
VAGSGRDWVARLAAPTAFLLAATVAVLLVRSALEDDAAPPSRPASTATVPAPTGTTPTGTGGQARERFYVIKAGDTLAGIAERYGTTVQALLELNPEIDPVALSVGQRIRVQ